MKKELIICFAILLITCRFAYAQDNYSWQHKTCAVVLTYDDALDVDLDHAIPVLDSLGLKATFYLSGYSGSLNNRMADWRKIAMEGHELGNHTFFHPCTGKIKGREFVSADYDLSNYTFRRITDEIKMTNTLLKAVDGKTKRTFAYPCGDTKIGDSSYLDPLKSEFVGARGVNGGMPTVNNVDLYNINCYAINGQTGNELIALVKEALDKKALLVFLFHGVGGGHNLNVSMAAHSQLLHYLKKNEKDIWIAPMVEVASYIKKHKETN